METNATRMCALIVSVIVGLPDIVVLGVEDEAPGPLRVHVETTAALVGWGTSRGWCRRVRAHH